MANCAFPTCTVTRTEKYKEIGIFKLPTRKTEFYSTWRKGMLDIISKYRVMDSAFKKKVMECEVNLFICERHFAPNDIEFTKKGKKTLRLQALPTINLPVKSHETPVVERRHINIVTEFKDVDMEQQLCYNNFPELIKRVENLKLQHWSVVRTDDKISFKYYVQPYMIPYLDVTVSENLEFRIIVFAWLLPYTHEIYKRYSRSMYNVTVSDLLKDILSFKLCPALSIKSNQLISHVIPCHVNLEEHNLPYVAKEYYRHKECLVLHTTTDEPCLKCTKFEHSQKEKSKKVNVAPCHSNAPLSKTNPLRIIESLKLERKENKELKKRLEKEIQEKGVIVDEELSDDFHNIMASNGNDVSPFMKLFWEQQKELFGKGTSRRYHPMIIRFCLSLACKSASAYDELRSSNVLTLPSRRTLRDYKNAIKPHAGFNPSVIEELIKIAERLQGYQRYVVLSFDEMKIKENLVYDKYSGDLVGYVDLGDPDTNYSSFENADSLATHVLVFYVRGLASDLKFELGYFGTNGALQHQIMTRFWRAVGLLESTCSLKVIATVSDGATANRAFYRMNKEPNNTQFENDVVYRTVNLYDATRFIWFFADAPHLMKTTRNCIYNSGNGNKQTRLMWNSGSEIVWKHFLDIVNDESQFGLKLISKLTDEHVRLNPYSKMNVRLATQILSETSSNILFKYYPENTHATAELCFYMDKFFDCLNVRSQYEGKNKRKPFLLPYEKENDERFMWLTDEFLPYLAQWKSSTDCRLGNFSNRDRGKMFLSFQTYEGIKISVHSLIECVQYLLKSGMPYILSERFNQDVLEENFGRHRGLGRRNDNPTLHQFGYDSNTIRMARSVAPVTGNTKGKQKKKRHVSWSIVDHTPLPKRISGNGVTL